MVPAWPDCLQIVVCVMCEHGLPARTSLHRQFYGFIDRAFGRVFVDGQRTAEGDGANDRPWEWVIKATPLSPACKEIHCRLFFFYFFVYTPYTYWKRFIL